ncbi:hypothetical protein BBO99_00002079 [Phytophthora kernoviae]|uniref:Disease resistance R13L4/SHOC-2-like LRR domain-containing protein n=2 Tax=Phytophthora kernoviae TaxID=325452 RepID=A0A421FIP6_9STRA|nr:hypothetical protein G195_003503 [Phytophthora kernoviae 00238/432]KAG2532568.1 hypothetical protein JM18_000425 [Phytophthora kernoviae]RLN45513.1 hypothetical protein BBI17_001916 [Phytophthora kernoviae]RLN83508.1 hypothetical protein BBO99_00002079 [Phytophthora kernoviae]
MDKLDQNLSERFGALTSLKELVLSGNKLSCLPNSIGLLENLESLHVEENALTALPEQIGALRKLHVLIAHTNQLTSLPSSFGALRNIQNLDLKKNQLESTGDALATLSGLKFLDLRQNKLVVFPVLPEGAALDQVFLGYNTLSSIDEISILRIEDSVTILDMRDNKLQGLPANLACLYRLKTLDVANNDLTDLPPGLGYLKHLNHFIVDGVLPADLVSQGQFNFGETLLHLNLSSNQFRVLPAEIGELKLLKTLTVESNELQSLHPSIAGLPHLELLRLQKNQLSAESISEFLHNSTALGRSLKELDLRNNCLTSMPLELCQLHSLETLLLAFNRIETLEQFPWSQLTNVSLISISNNKLRSLGRIYDAPLLASLSFENNNLTKVPCELGLCPNLRAIYMNGNPQRTVRGAVIAKGSTEILTYLKNKLPPNAVLPPPSPMTRAFKTDQVGSTQISSSREGRTPSGTPRSANTAYAAHGNYAQDEGPAPVAPVDSFAPIVENSAVDVELVKLSAQIEQLESQLDNPSLSAPKRFALKKELAVVRAKKIREARKIK